MSFGVYRPTMGVAGGHRELSGNRPMLEQRQNAEQMGRQENVNPITGEMMGGPVGRPPPGPRKQLGPTGNIGVGLVPSTGPLDHGILSEKDVPSKRVDPTRNQSTSLHSGVACLAHENGDWEVGAIPRMEPSRIGESCFGQGMCERPRSGSLSRRSTPGQVVRGNNRPKDNLSGGCVTSDKDVDHPLNLPGKASRAGAGRGSGGDCNIIQGPNGFVPRGPQDTFMQMAPRSSSRDSGQRPFRRMVGVAS